MALPCSRQYQTIRRQGSTHPLLFPHGDLLFPLLHAPLPSLDVNLVDISARDLAVGVIVIRYKAVQLGFLVCGGAPTDIGLHQATVHGQRVNLGQDGRIVCIVVKVEW